MAAAPVRVREAVSLVRDRRGIQVVECDMFALCATTSIRAVRVLDVVQKCKGLTFR